MRDLLRQRSRLVRQHTANVLAVQKLFARDLGHSLSANAIRRLTPERVSELLPDPNRALAVQSALLAMHEQGAAVDLSERHIPAPRSAARRATPAGLGAVIPRPSRAHRWPSAPPV